MSDTDLYDDGNLDDLEPDLQQRENHNLKRLREKAKDADRLASEATQAKAEATAAKRELAMVRAGIDLDSPTGKLLTKAYDGEPTVEAVRAFAVEYGVIDPPAEVLEQMTQEQALARLSTSAQGASAPSGVREIDSDTYASWDPSTRASFRAKHPREFEALKAGRAVPAIPGF